MAYLNSEKIKIFPYGSFRGTSLSDGRVLNEQNITTLINVLTDINSYVISYDNNIIKFVIGGYYIEANLDESGLTSGSLYAGINLTTAAGIPYLDGTDGTDGHFTGVTFSSDELTKSEYTYVLQLLADGNICSTSQQRFKDKSFGVLTGSVTQSDLDDLESRLKNYVDSISIIKCGSATDLTN